MTKATTIKTISIAAIIAVASSLGSTASAHDISNAGVGVSAIETQRSITKNNAKSLVKQLLKREYSGEGFEARTTRKVGDKWKVSIKNRLRTVATAYVDTKTGNIHVE